MIADFNHSLLISGLDVMVWSALRPTVNSSIKNSAFQSHSGSAHLSPKYPPKSAKASLIQISSHQVQGGHSDSHQSKKDSDSHHAATRTHNTEITLFYAARTHTRLAPTTPRPAPNAVRTTFAYSLTLRPVRLAPTATRTPKRLAPFL